jgi:putative endonuclease
MYTTYVMQSKTFGIRYVGSTSDITKRINAHNTGFSKYTKGRGPWFLVYKEAFPTRSEAMARELFFKTGKGRLFLDSKIKTD